MCVRKWELWGWELLLEQLSACLTVSIDASNELFCGDLQSYCWNCRWSSCAVGSTDHSDRCVHSLYSLAKEAANWRYAISLPHVSLHKWVSNELCLVPQLINCRSIIIIIMQTSVACVVSPNLSQQLVTALLSELHWLPVNSRIIFKLACLTYKLLTTSQPAYLHTLLHPYTHSTVD